MSIHNLEFWENHIKLMVKKYHKQNNSVYDENDLINISRVVVIKTIEKYPNFTEEELGKQISLNIKRRIIDEYRKFIHNNRRIHQYQIYSIEENELLKKQIQEIPQVIKHIDIDLLSKVRQLINTLLSQKEKQVIIHYFLKEKTLKHIGKSMGFTESRANQIKKSALKKIQIGLKTLNL